MMLIDFNTFAKSNSVEKEYLCPVDVIGCSFNNKFHENLSDPELKVLRLHDVYIDNNFFVKTRNNEVIRDIGYEGKLSSVHNLSRAESKGFHHDEVFLLGGHNNYYHWLLNWLPRLFFYEMLDLKCPILVNSDFSDMQLRVLQTLFPNIKKELLVNAKKIQRVKTLHLPVFFKNPMHSPFAIRNIRNRIFGLYKSDMEQPRFSSNIFISREKASSRNIINEKNIYDHLARYGYEKLVLEELSILEQVNAFYFAQNIIAPHGAGLANLVFCTKKPNIIEMMAHGHYTKMYWSLGVLCGCQSYQTIKSNDVHANIEKVPNYKKDIEINISDLLKYIA